ncbi:MAG TPA: 3-deoxy-manno-octulosonate cytidylyltransferase [Thermoanaerobaculia bacterium]|nr:3-deoxy-manno-octulosonate cytidylyltransferase [Thermoanaerobaculia bacterium]
MPASEKPDDTETVSRPRIVAAIPARYGSTRLPAKPLAEISGRPLIEHVYRATAAARGLTRVVVLTDDERIGAAVEAFGGDWEMTPADCASGTDRIAFAARGWEADFVLNVQGDWILDPGAIETLAGHLGGQPDERLATLAVPATAEELGNPAAVKVVCDLFGYALYFSRSEIPFRRQAGGPPTLKHWGIYGYRRDTLLTLADLPQSPLERAESLEQLRALENGIPIRVLAIDGEALGVDTPEDLEAARGKLASRNLASQRSGGAHG